MRSCFSSFNQRYFCKNTGHIILNPVVVQSTTRFAEPGFAMMLSPLKELLREYRMVLASTSAQRKAIWQQMGINFSALPSSFDEESVQQTAFKTPSDYVCYLANGKASAVVQKLKDERNTGRSIVVGADTVIVAETGIIGKPHTKDKAMETLGYLSGKTHRVITGVAIIVSGDTGVSFDDSFVSTTEVVFSSLSKELIQSYVETGEPLNKAGAYGIQGLGSRLVESITGDYYNVVGFPINQFCERLEALLRTNST